MAGMILYMAVTALAVGLLIVVHEFGHFVAAKAIGVRVETFSVGFGTKLLSATYGDTEYALSAVPLGGYVKLAGEHPDESEGKPDEFYSKSPGQRAIVFSAGVVFNAVLAVLCFIAAFTVGVPFTEASVGQMAQGGPAWEVGLQRGDQIVSIDDQPVRDYNDLSRYVALSAGDTVTVDVKRGGEALSYRMKPEYNPQQGFDWLGFGPPMAPTVMGLGKTVGQEGRCPACEAGIKLRDRIVAVNGASVDTAAEVGEMLEELPQRQVSVTVERDGEKHQLMAMTEARRNYGIGISYVTATIEALRSGGVAAENGLRPGDTITAVNGEEVQSIVAVRDILEDAGEETELTVTRGDSGTTTVTVDLSARDAAEDFLFGIQCAVTDRLTWVEEGSPAWKAGMRPGDVITSVDGENVDDWEAIKRAIANKQDSPLGISWRHEDEEQSATVTPVIMDEVGILGIQFTETKKTIQRYGIGGAVKAGFSKTYGTVADMYLTIRGFARQEVSPKTMGGIITIAYVTYSAARQGVGKLFYFMAFISATLAFINILPIPVLDGGHIVFVGIEKLRGKPVSEKVMAIVQYIGLAFLILLILYVTKNDIVRLFGL